MNNSVDSPSITFPKSWEHARKEGKKEVKGLRDYIIQGIALAILLVISLPFLPIIGLCRIVGSLREKVVTALGYNKTLLSVRAMKDIEETNKFQAMKDVLNSKFKNQLKPYSVSEITNSFVQDIDFNNSMIVNLLAEECKRLIIREICRKSGFQSNMMSELIDWKIDRGCINENGSIDWSLIPESIHDLLQNSKELETSFITHLSVKMQRRHMELSGIVRDQTKQLESFVNRFNKMTEVLLDVKNLQKSDPAKANRNFIAAYREVLKHPIYKALKMSHSHRSVTLLHDLGAAIWNAVDAKDAYKNVGKAIIADGNLSYQNEVIDQNVPENVVLANKLKQSQKIVASNHYHNDTVWGKISYATMHFWQVMGSLASEGGVARSIPFLFSVDQYDSHGTLSNNPSIQGTTCWSGKNDGISFNGSVNNCYGGSPTIGDHRIAPEFKALLQAVENNLMQPTRARRKNIPLRIIYASLQDLDKTHGESPRSQTIMHLNQAFPLSFTGYVLAKDSPLYAMKKKPTDVVWENAEQFGQALKAKLMLGVNAPTQKGHGFYFHGFAGTWERLFDSIIQEVNQEFKDKEALTSKQKEQLQSAYQDYVYSLLGAAVECGTLSELNNMGAIEPTIITLNACKENIDRGGMENLKILFLRIKKLQTENGPLTKDEVLEALVGFMNVRSLSARDRAILEHRVDQVLPFIEIVSPEDFEGSLMRLLNKLGLDAKFEFDV